MSKQTCPCCSGACPIDFPLPTNTLEEKLKVMSAWDLIVLLQGFVFDSSDDLSHAAGLEKWDVADNIVRNMKAVTTVVEMIGAVIHISEIKERESKNGPVTIGGLTREQHIAKRREEDA